MKKKILWLVVARSGSKSIPDKNIKLLGGHPLLSYRIKSAIHSVHSNDLWISTDSSNYAEIAKGYGAEVPFMRPSELATDKATSVDVVLQAMQFANALNRMYDFIALLEPTSPFVSTKDLDDAVFKLESERDASSIVAVRESRPNKIFVQERGDFLEQLARNLVKIKEMGRQSFIKEVTPSGGFYISRWTNFLENKSFYNIDTLAYEVDDISGLEIDEPIDWLFADFIVEKKMFDLNKLFGS